jgi:hypothetical protein
VNFCYYVKTETKEGIYDVINYESNQQDATVWVNLLFLVSSTCKSVKHNFIVISTMT